MTRRARRRITALSAIAATVSLAAAACSSAATSSSTSAAGSTPGAAITLSFLSYNYGTPDLGGKGTRT